MAQIRQSDLLESRFSAKSDLEHTNSFSDEGIYHCVVTNIRGGNIPVERKLKRLRWSFVNIACPTWPLLNLLSPARTREEVRKDGQLINPYMAPLSEATPEIVTIRYAEGSFYEGPYIGKNSWTLLAES